MSADSVSARVHAFKATLLALSLPSDSSLGCWLRSAPSTGETADRLEVEAGVWGDGHVALGKVRLLRGASVFEQRPGPIAASFHRRNHKRGFVLLNFNKIIICAAD